MLGLPRPHAPPAPLCSTGGQTGDKGATLERPHHISGGSELHGGDRSHLISRYPFVCELRLHPPQRYYLTDGAPTFFDDPCTPRVYDTLDVWYHDKMESDWGINEKVDAEAGKLILFPSWLKHYSGRQMDDYDRWTISFNSVL